MSSHVATYDVSSDSDRRRVARVLRRYGKRIQESVFEVELEPEEIGELQREIGPLLRPTDRFDLFPIDRRRPFGRVRWQHPLYPERVRLC